MTPDIFANLLVNVGFAAALAAYLVWQNSQRQNTEATAKAELELFIRETLMRVIEENSSEKRENHILLMKCVDALDRCVNILKTIEVDDEHPAD